MNMPDLPDLEAWTLKNGISLALFSLIVSVVFFLLSIGYRPAFGAGLLFIAIAFILAMVTSMMRSFK